MTRTMRILLAGLSCSAFATTAVAQDVMSVLNGFYQGDEQAVFRVIDVDELGFCSADNEPLIHHEVGPIRVKRDGTYEIRDAGWWVAWDTVTSFHDGPVDPNNPDANLVGWVDDVGEVDLESGVDYYVVVQPFCRDFPYARGLWAITITGRGEATGPQIVPAEEHWMGEWDSNLNLVDTSPSNFDCENRFYKESGPHQLDRGGNYFLSAISAFDDDPYVGVFLAVYDQPFNPSKPRQNQVAWQWDSWALFDDDFNPVDLEAGKDYWFVVQPGCQLRTGPFQYVLFPERPFEFNSFSSGAYYDRMTPGQGELFEFHPPPPQGSGFTFGAWFTWTTEQPPANVQSLDGTSTQEVGDARQRWLTMQGFYDLGDSTIELEVTNTMGGVFNDPAPVENSKAGTATLEMESCRKGVLNFDLDSGESGSTVVERVLDENVEFCESWFFGPGLLDGAD